MSKPIVAIVGRPNVGKSTLFNRLVGERRAIVQDQPGTTRDRVYGAAEWIGVEFTVIDTGGLQDEDEVSNDPDDSETLIAQQTRNQAQSAIAEADVIVFMVDSTNDPTSSDAEIAGVLRRADKPTILAVNKADSLARREMAYEYF
ncbi:MAG: GTPase, partial [Thermomicrobiales bacterium]